MIKPPFSQRARPLPRLDAPRNFLLRRWASLKARFGTTSPACDPERSSQF
jgi:hypothetical protein